MSTFRHRFEVVLDGEALEVRTFAGDNTEAERFLARQKVPVDQGQQLLYFRTTFNAFSRTYPDHPLAKNFQKYLDVLDDINDLEPAEAEDADPLDPTLAADWES
jgi:hypothetical protein